MSGDSEPDTGPYIALRALDEALPGELDSEGWGSDDDWDYRGPATCVSPPSRGAQAPRRRREGWVVNSGKVVTRKLLSGTSAVTPGTTCRWHLACHKPLLDRRWNHRRIGGLSPNL
jgi:hypothetical protein